LNNNDLLRRLRYALRCDDAQTAKLVQLGGSDATTAQAARWRAKEDTDDHLPCSNAVVESFLGGLIIENRGPREQPASSPWPDRSKTTQKQSAKTDPPSSANQLSRSGSAKCTQIDNNLVLKQLRIALSLRSDDVHAILKSGGSALSASEAGALFRKPDARNYRQCGDQVLRQFIAGLVKRREQQPVDKS